jgi:hypothetical protein
MVKKSVKFEAVGSRIEIIGGNIYPKKESWKPLCPHCGKPLRITLTWVQEACEFQLEMEREE